VEKLTEMQGAVSGRKMLGHQVLSPIKVSSSVAVFTASETKNRAAIKLLLRP
jgi:hypothetical protein